MASDPEVEVRTIIMPHGVIIPIVIPKGARMDPAPTWLLWFVAAMSAVAVVFCVWVVVSVL